MTTVVVTIEGVAYTYHGATLNIQQQTNGRNKLTLEVDSLDGSYRPAVDDEVIVTESGTRRFGGVIEDYEESSIGGDETAGPGLRYSITIVDFNSYADRRYVNTILPAGTLKSQLELLEPHVADYGVVLDPAQANGPSMPDVALPFMRVDEALNLLAELAAPLSAQAVAWEIDYNKLLRMFEVLDGSHAAPFNITASNAADYIVGGLRVRPKMTDYATGIHVVYGEGRAEQVDTLGVGDGIEDTFAFHLLPTSLHGYINVGGTLSAGVIVGGTNEGLGYASEGLTWVYDPVTNSATRSSPPSAAQNILCPYEAQFPGLVSVNDGGPASAIRERLYTEPKIFDVVQAQAVAEALLAKTNIQFKEVEYKTHTSGLFPGQIQTITLSKHGISGSHLIIEVHVDDYKESRFTYTVKAIAGSDVLPESWMRTYEDWGRGSATGGGGSVTVFTGSPARPAFFLGGSSTLYVQDPTPTWIAADAVRVTIDTAIRQSAAGTVYCRLRATSGNVTARLRNITDGTTAGTSAVVSSSSWTDADFAVTLASGAKVYELQLLPSVANTDVAGVGTFI